jgi:hypothetical protein
MENEIPGESRKILKAHILAFITIFIWGTTYISTKMLLLEFTPTEIFFSVLSPLMRRCWPSSRRGSHIRIRRKSCSLPPQVYAASLCIL